MKNKTLAACCLAFSLLGAQKSRTEFEGVVVYSNYIVSKTPEFTSDTLQKAYGPTMTLYYKAGNYKMVFSGNDIKEIYYLKADNKQYVLRKGIDTLYYTSCELEMRPLVSSTLSSRDGKVMNKKCDKLVNDLGDVKNFYWFHPDLYVNPDHFKQHVLGAVNLYFEKAKAFWLKYRFEDPFIVISHTAVKVKKQKVPDSALQLPPFPKINQF